MKNSHLNISKPFGKLTAEEARNLQYGYLAEDFDNFKASANTHGVNLSFSLTPEKLQVLKAMQGDK